MLTQKYGPVDGFSPGAWWGILMDCARDKVHYSYNLNVNPGPFGAISLCTPQANQHKDMDLGECLTFTGRRYDANWRNEPLGLSFRNQIPVRLIRCCNLSNEFAPNTGFRYYTHNSLKFFSHLSV